MQETNDSVFHLRKETSLIPIFCQVKSNSHLSNETCGRNISRAKEGTAAIVKRLNECFIGGHPLKEISLANTRVIITPIKPVEHKNAH